MFRYGSVEVHPIVIDTVMMKIPSIVEYQAWQTNTGVDLNVVAHGEIDPSPLAAALESGLRQAGLVSAKATVRFVDEIPRHPETGKTRRFVALA
jgi:hypothetical protein